MTSNQTNPMSQTRKGQGAESSGQQGCTTPRSADPQAELRRRYIAVCAARSKQIAALVAAGMTEPAASMRVSPIDLEPFMDLRCGARSKRTGKPCPQKGLYACGRCRWHGGLSTGPRSEDGKRRSAANGGLRGARHAAAATNEPHDPANVLARVAGTARHEGGAAATQCSPDLPIGLVGQKILVFLKSRSWPGASLQQIADHLGVAGGSLSWQLHLLLGRGMICSFEPSDQRGNRRFRLVNRLLK